MLRRKVVRLTLGVLIGGIGGYLYYYFIGCNSGRCPIASNPYLTILLGIVVGLIIVSPTLDK